MYMNNMQFEPQFPGHGDDPDRPGHGMSGPGNSRGAGFFGNQENPEPFTDPGVVSDDIVEGDWLSVAEAVAYCASRGLSRNIKTVRRWAHRSFAHPESAEVLVRKQDTDTDFRYVIERGSLDVKIAQELDFEKQKLKVGISGQVQPGTAMSGDAVIRNDKETPHRTDTDAPEPVRAGAPLSGVNDEPKTKDNEKSVTEDEETANLRPGRIDEAFYQQQIEEKDRQIGKLHTQLERRDEQIMSMLERDRETNILIKGLQEALLPVSRDEDDTRTRKLSVKSHSRGDIDDGRDQADGV
jgi:hypothetical protein